MFVEDGSNRYLLGDLVSETEKYLLFLCVREGSENELLLQIARTSLANGEVKRMAFVLEELRKLSDELEVEFAKVKKDENEVLNYYLGIPALESSFKCRDAALLRKLLGKDYDGKGERQVNVLEFNYIKDVSRLVPLNNITDVDGKRLDCRTSAWIMGKALKTLTLASNGNISVGVIDGTNILVAPDEHYVIFFDWTRAKMYPGPVPEDIQQREISLVARAVVVALGGDPETGYLPGSGDEAMSLYMDYLLYLARGSESNIFRAHREFYRIVETMWKREFYPFTTLPLEG